MGMTEVPLRRLVEAAIAAPSVHNVQPARWRIEGDALLLLEDMSRRLAVGDPTGNDAAISLGAAAEGLRLAASRAGLAAIESRSELPAATGALRPVARFRFEPGAANDPLAEWLEQRASWRGNFLPPTEADRTAAATLEADDARVATEPAALAALARDFDRASYGFTRRSDFRGELRSWMRLGRSHPLWSHDGLNADAMALSRVEALGAGLVLGPLFVSLDKLGLARTLLAEGGKVERGAAVVLFHRPVDEDPYESGRHFHRLWLAIERAGFGAAVLAALADDREAAREIIAAYGIPPGRRLVSAFRIGRRAGPGYPRARLPLSSVLV
jgi:nitroreductase